MRFTLLALLLLAMPAFAQEAEVGLVNGALEGDEDGDGIADGWQYASGAGEDKLDVAFSLDEGRDGGASQKIVCTRFDDGHVMLCQIAKWRSSAASGIVSTCGCAGRWTGRFACPSVTPTAG